MRSEFFVLSLKPVLHLQTSETKAAVKRMAQVFEEYLGDVGGRVDPDSEPELRSNPLVDMRHTFLELSQMRHLQFSTLRLAKYSSTILLYYLHRPDANSLAPCCDNCKVCITKTRWHAAQDLAEVNLCTPCYEKVKGQNTSKVFTPFRITFDAEKSKRQRKKMTTSTSGGGR